MTPISLKELCEKHWPEGCPLFEKSNLVGWPMFILPVYEKVALNDSSRYERWLPIIASVAAEFHEQEAREEWEAATKFVAIEDWPKRMAGIAKYHEIRKSVHAWRSIIQWEARDEAE